MLRQRKSLFHLSLTMPSVSPNLDSDSTIVAFEKPPSINICFVTVPNCEMGALRQKVWFLLQEVNTHTHASTPIPCTGYSFTYMNWVVNLVEIALQILLSGI